jgi:hypothetical protein
VYDAMTRKAAAGQVTGARVFGYDNREVLGASGQRSHAERQINEAEAGVVRRISRCLPPAPVSPASPER